MVKKSTARKTGSTKRPAVVAGQRKRNLPAEERRRLILDAATDLFSEKGLGITVQALADRVHVTQPLIHRYFPAKSDLIAAIWDRIQNAHWDPTWKKILTDRNRPLEERIPYFYSQYLPHIYRDTWYRGFWYAALTDPRFAQVFITRAVRELFTAIIDEVRAHFRYPSVATIPIFERETELLWGMHSTMIFVGIRRYVYHTPVSDEIDMIVRDQMGAYLLMAPRVLEELMPDSVARKLRAAKRSIG